MKYNSKILFVTVVILGCAFIVHGQSGRRQQRVEPAAPVPTPTPEPTPKPKAEQKNPDLIFYIGADRNTSYTTYPYSYYDAALTGCAEVLRRNSSAQVDVTNNDLSRGEAIKRSKENAKIYTVLLTLSSKTMSSRPSDSRYDEVELEYIVFAPGTAKIVTSGRTYQNANRKGPVIVGPTGGPTSALYRETLLKRAGEEAGDRILRALHLITPKTN